MARTKGAKDISPDKKARILAKKNTNLSTLSGIAEQEGVSRFAVHAIKESNVSEEVRQLARRYEGEFITYARAIALKAQQQTLATLHELTADKAAIVAEKNFNIAQVWSNRPTQITKSVDDMAFRMFQILIEQHNFTREEAIEGVLLEFPNVDQRLLEDGSV